MARSTASTRGLTEGVIWKQLLAYFFPILFGTFFQQLYNTADAMIVGQFVGKQALAAVGGATGTLVNFIVNLFVGLSSGTTVIVAQLYGAGEHKRVGDAVHTSLALAITAGFGMTVVSLLLARPALTVMGTPEDVMPYALTYLRTVLLGVVPSFLYNMGSGVLRAVGDTKRPLYFLIAACLTNIVLDLILVAGLGMGVFGAALATILSQALSAVLTLLCLAGSGACYRFEPAKLRFTKGVLGGVLRVGIPAGLQSNMYSISNIIIQTCINSFGTDTMAAWTAHGKIDGFFWMIMGAFGISITAFAGQNFGARKYDRIRESVRDCLILSAITALAIGGLYYGFAGPLQRIFTSDEAVLAIGRQIVGLTVPFYFTYICIEIMAGAIRGCGEAMPPMLMVAGGVCVLRIVWIAVMLSFHRQLSTVLVSYPLSWAVTSVIFVVYYLRGNWLKRCIKKSFGSQEEEAKP